MISSQALHLGFLIIPWTLLIVLLGLLAVFLVGLYFNKQQQWNDVIWQRYKDAIWSSIWVGFLLARVVFVLNHYDLYFAHPIEILKVNDKGFNFYAGVIAGCFWFSWKNRTLGLVVLTSSVLAFILTQTFGLSVLKHLGSQQQYPDLSFTAIGQLAKQSTQSDNSAIQSSAQPIKQESVPSHIDTKISLIQFIGKPTIINLWASWCPPCHKEMPLFYQAQIDHPNVQFVFINQGEDADTIDSYLQRNQLYLNHVLLDPSGQMASRMNMFGLPSTLFFNAKGELIDQHLGELNQPMLKQYLYTLTSQPEY